jgi:hypothetical protein
MRERTKWGKNPSPIGVADLEFAAIHDIWNEEL